MHYKIVANPNNEGEGLRFLFVSDFLRDDASGAAGSIVAIGRALFERGHSVEYLWKEPPNFLSIHPRLRELFQLPAGQRAQVRARLQLQAYDVVIVSQPYAYLIFEQLVPLYPSTLFLNRTHGWEARLDALETQLGWKHSIPLVRRPLIFASAWGRSRACSRTARSAPAVICPSSNCAHFIRDEYAVDSDAVPVIPYGADAHLFETTRRPPASDAPTRLLYVGNYLRRKGSDIMAESLPAVGQRHPDLTLTFVTHPSSFPVLETHYRNAFGARLSVLPWRARADLADIYASHDILLFPSLFEGFGKTFLEAMACGLCVIGFGEGGVSDLCESEKTALFRAPTTAATLTSLLEEAIAAPERTRQIGAAARVAVQGFTWAAAAEKTERFCRSRLAKLRKIGARDKTGAGTNER